MTLHKLTAGDGYTYLTRQVAAADATHRGYSDLESYYSEKGETPGVWMGSGLAGVLDFPRPGEPVFEAQMRALFGEGRHPNADAIEVAARAAGKNAFEIDAASRLGNPYRIHAQVNEFYRRCAGVYRDYNTARDREPDAPVPEVERSRIRTSIAAVMFGESFGREPADARELSGHLARISRPATTAVAGYDLTFSPVKSVSTLWAIGPPEVAAAIEQAHRDAVADTLRWLERHAAYTRLGRGGVAQVEVTGLVAAAFTHRDSRAGDPDLHTHVAVANKVRTGDGRWLALDGRLLFRNNVPASERYNTRLEALLTDRLGVVFADRPGGDAGKRPVREIVGIDGPLPRAWSSRRAAIDTRRAHLAADFQRAHGRPPTVNEARELAQRANLETRQGKHEPRSHAELRAAWRAEAIAVLGDEQRVNDYVNGALHPAVRSRTRVNQRWVRRTAGRVVGVVQGSRAAWQEHHVRAEAERQVRAANLRAVDVDAAVERITAHALSEASSVRLDSAEPISEPAALRRSDGSSVYTVAGSALYTSEAVLRAEQAIIAAAGRRDGRRTDTGSVDVALVESAANGVELNPGQVHLVRAVACSGARVQLALAPAGTGKTAAMGALSRAWQSGGGTVVGLAPSAAAAAVLRDELDAPTDTVAKLVWHLHDDNNGQPPAWMTAIDARTLVVVDEAGMAGTPDLAAVIAHALARGGSVRLIGDDRQLAAVGAGGVLRDLAEGHGAVTLSQVVRFIDPATGAPNRDEGAASLALRDGDPAAIAYYLDHKRVHVGDEAITTDNAYTAWASDIAAGRDSVMLAPTRDLVAALNTRARHHRLHNQSGPVGIEITLSDGTRASAGDAIITRRNDRRIPIGVTDWVRNGDRWTITTIRDSGALDAIHHRTGRRITLPAAYAAQHIALGYATTVHGAQGITAEVCHTIVTGAESRQLLYVALTRGRHANHLYVVTASNGDSHAITTPDAVTPPTAVDILTRILQRDAAPASATSTTRTTADPGVRLARAANSYHHALHAAATEHLRRQHGPAALARIDHAANNTLPGLTAWGGYPTLRAHLALHAVAGHDPATVLYQAIAQRDLGDARDLAAVLDWRLDPTSKQAAPIGTGPLPWLPAIPVPLRSDPQWASYLQQRAEQVAGHAAAVTTRANIWTPTTAPTWATDLVDRDRQLVADLAVWRAAYHVADADRRPTGPPQPAAADARAQHALDQRVQHLTSDGDGLSKPWKRAIDHIDQRITDDPDWRWVSERLATATRAGIDIPALLHAAATAGPLPDELPAAALWWRIAAHLSPAAITATSHADVHTVRPDWVPALTDLLDPAAASRVQADPTWPALVAAATDGTRCGWQPEQLLTTAHELLLAGHPTDTPIRPAELATALTWRIGLLTDPVPMTDTPVDPRSGGVEETAGLADALPDLDEHWLATATPAEPGDHEPVPTEPSDADGRIDQPPILSIDTKKTSGDRSRTAALAADRQVAVPRDRLADLNTLASEFFIDHYRDTWAPDYLTARLGTDLTTDARYVVGYAPDSWTALTTHLRRNGATDREIISAGLGTRSRSGGLVDRFRDRLVFPITAPTDTGQPEIHGWIGRRNPAMTDDDRAGPKYLNTPNTELFTKGSELYGLAEGTLALAAGATPVLVEGPLDAIAITLAGNGRYIGIAPLGTALTDTQTDTLHHHLTHASTREPIVATDPDAAGQQAAHRAYWQLTARRLTPRHLPLPHDLDPADLHRAHGPEALRNALDTAGSLAPAVITARIAHYADRLDTVEGQVLATRRAAIAIAADQPEHWPHHVNQVSAHTGLPAAIVQAEVITAADEWRANPRQAAQQQMRGHHAPAGRPIAPDERWAGLANAIDPALTTDPHWPALAHSIDQAASAGVNVQAMLPRLAANPPLPTRHAVRTLDLRLADAAARSATPRSVDAPHRRTNPAAAQHRIDTANQIAARHATPTPQEHPARPI